MHPDKVVTWTKAASALVIGFGILSVLAAHPASSGLFQILIDMIFWPLDGAESLSAPATRLMSAIGGGLMVGWGLMLSMVATRLYPREPDLARMMILTSIGAWFVVDSAGSIAAGAPLNALFNFVFLLMFVGPLWRTSRQAAVGNSQDKPGRPT